MLGLKWVSLELKETIHMEKGEGKVYKPKNSQ